MQILRKISVAAMNTVKGGFKSPAEKTFAGRIYGVARTVAVVTEGNYGPSLKFGGEFKSVNMDGEIAQSPVLYLPGPVDELLKAALEGQPEGTKGVEFGFDVFLIPDASNKFGYTYRVETLIESKPSEPLAALENAIGGKPLPAKPKQLVLEGAATETAAVETTATEKTDAPAPAPAPEKAAAGGKKK